MFDIILPTALFLITWSPTIIGAAMIYKMEI